jgi:hypothetical protein
MALTQHRKSIIFRREAKQLREIVDQSREIIGEFGRFNENLLLWRGLPEDRVLELGGVKDEKDVNNWRGRPHDFIGFDELPEFSRRQFLTLSAWNRTTVKGQKCRIVAAFNPPNTSEGQWVIEYFAPWIDKKYPNPAKPGEIRWFAVIDEKDVERPDGKPFDHEGRTVIPKSRTFIPAKLVDNPYLAETGYESTLMALDEVQRKQLLEGDFTTMMGDDAQQVIPSAWVEAAIERWKKGARPTTSMLSLGIDVSRGGSDLSVFAPRYGNWIDPLVKFPGSEITNGQAIVSRMINIYEDGAVINIDANSWGSSAYDQMCEKNYNVIGTIAQEGCEDRDKSGKYGFVNVRARDWWHVREMLDPTSGENVCLPDDPELKSDLIAPRFFYRGGKIGVELKEEIKKRRGKSTDCGDAVVLALADAAAMPNFRTLG